MIFEILKSSPLKSPPRSAIESGRRRLSDVRPSASVQPARSSFAKTFIDPFPLPPTPAPTLSQN